MENLYDFLHFKKDELTYEEVIKLMDSGVLKDVYLLQEWTVNCVYVNTIIIAKNDELAKELAKEEFKRDCDFESKSHNKGFSKNVSYDVVLLLDEIEATRECWIWENTRESQGGDPFQDYMDTMINSIQKYEDCRVIHTSF